MNKSDIERISVVETEIKNLKEDNAKEHLEIKQCLNQIDGKLDKAVQLKLDKEDFVFWRNLLVSGILVSIFLMCLSMMIK